MKEIDRGRGGGGEGGGEDNGRGGVMPQSLIPFIANDCSYCTILFMIRHNSNTGNSVYKELILTAGIVLSGT